MAQPFSNIAAWSQRLVREVLSEGDLAIDLTAGNGYDTLMLAQSVGVSGRVLAFDLQSRALENTASRLVTQNIQVRRIVDPLAELQTGVNLVLADHADFSVWCVRRPQAVIANLGYLPGADKNLVTKPVSTLAALSSACGHLAAGGRLAVVVYPGHPGGSTEAMAVEQFFCQLDENLFEVLQLRVANRKQAPLLFVASKLS